MTVDHSKEHKTDAKSQRRSNVTFPSVLTSLSPHEVLADVHLSELILVETEDGHPMQSAIDKSTGAHDVAEDRNSPPDGRCDQKRARLHYNCNQQGEDAKDRKVFD